MSGRFNCERCGRFMAEADSVAVWAFEVGEFGQLLSKRPVSCRHCAPDPVLVGVLADFDRAPRAVLNVNGQDVQTDVPIALQPRHEVRGPA
jgi:hypothetical protein